MLWGIHLGESMTYATARQMIFKICNMANVIKQMNLNLFRHSEVTITANYVTEA